MKKGFTLVELSIVLVIIGILLGMVVKGKSLIDSARLKSDMAKVNSLRSATAAYFADNAGKFPQYVAGAGSVPPSPRFTEAMLVQGGYIAQADLALRFGVGNMGLVFSANPTATTGAFTPASTGKVVLAILGQVTSNTATSPTTDTLPTVTANVRNSSLGCLMDITLDNAIQNSGDIRGFRSGTATTPYTVQICKGATENQISLGDTVTYAVVLL